MAAHLRAKESSTSAVQTPRTGASRLSLCTWCRVRPHTEAMADVKAMRPSGSGSDGGIVRWWRRAPIEEASCPQPRRGRIALSIERSVTAYGWARGEVLFRRGGGRTDRSFDLGRGAGMLFVWGGGGVVP